MRTLLLGLIFSAVALPCLAQTILKSDPLVLAPYEIAFVQHASCPAGKVLKVTGAIRGLHRRKACVTLAAEQASLAVATPWHGFSKWLLKRLISSFRVRAGAPWNDGGRCRRRGKVYASRMQMKFQLG